MSASDAGYRSLVLESFCGRREAVQPTWTHRGEPFLQTIKVHRLAGGPFSASLPDLAGLQCGDERRDSNMAIIDPGATKRPNARHNYEARGFKVTEEMRKPPNEPREGVIFTSK